MKRKYSLRLTMVLLRALGNVEEATAYLEGALATAEANYGPDHSDLVPILNNLGLLLRARGDLEGAEAHFERALAIAEAADGRFALESRRNVESWSGCRDRRREEARDWRLVG